MSLESLPDCEYLPQHDLTSFTTFRLKSVGDLLIVKSVPGLAKALPMLQKLGRNYLVLGWGANQILAAKNSDVILHLDFPFDLNQLSEMKSEYILPASLGINHLTSHAVKFGLKGWEVFTGIPASLGGAIYMNAGTNLGEIGPLMKSVRIMRPDGSIREEMIVAKSFSYRKNHFLQKGEVIIEATMIHHGQDPELPQKIREYLEYRKRTQPLATKNCGCVFKNPFKELPAGKLIDLLGLKSFGSGGLRVSSKHANFMENHGEANWDHFRDVVETIKFQMDHFYGIEFELEVKIPYH